MDRVKNGQTKVASTKQLLVEHFKKRGNEIGPKVNRRREKKTLERAVEK